MANNEYTISKIELPNGDVCNIKDTTYNFNTAYNATTNKAATMADIKTDNIRPIKSASFVTGKYGQDGSGTHYYEMLGSITPTSFEQMWLLHYIITIEVPNDTTYTYRADVEIYGVRDTYAAYKIFNSYYSKYPIYRHVILEGTSSSYPHEFGYRLASSYGDTTVNKNIHIDIIETRNCTAAFFNAPKAYTSSTPSNYTQYSFNASSNGLQESGDTDTYTRLYAGNNSMVVSSNFRLPGSAIFGFDRDNHAQGISLYSDGYTSTTTNINVNRVYNTAGFDWAKGLFYNTSSNFATGAEVTSGIDQSLHAIDFRYTDNCVNSSSLTTLGLERYKAVYLRGTIGADGLFYLAPLTVSYNNRDYKRAWIQDIPTSADGYVYWFLGFPYYNSSYAGGYQLNFYLENKLFWYHNGKFQEYIGDAVTVNGHTVNKDVPSDAKFTDNNTTYTFENGTNGFKVTPSGGSAQTVTVTPSITNNVTGSGTSGYLAKFNGANTITNGPQLGTSTTTFLNNKGEWATPTGNVTGIKGNAESSYRTGNVNLTPANIGAIATSAKGAASGVAELDSNGKVPSSQLPSYVDDVLEYAKSSSFPTTGESGKIYIAQDTNKTYRWSGTAYVEISASLALGTTSSTAYRGDYGNAAYAHAVTNKGSAFSSGLYKITTNSEGHVTAATAVAKSDITDLGIPGSNTTYTFDGTYNASTNKAATVSTVTNAIAALDGNLNNTTPGAGKTLTAFSETDGKVSATFGNISITKSQVSDLGTIGAAAAKGVDTSIAASSTSTNLPTSQAVAAFVEGKGYKTTDNNTTYSLTQDSSDGHKITLTPSSGTAQTITIPDNNTWRPVSDSVSSTSSSDAASSKAVKTAYDLAASKTANTGTVTSVATGVGLTGGTITGSGTLKTKLRSETALTIDSAAATTTSGRVYPVAVDKSGYLAVNVPWTDSKPVTSVAGKTGAVTLAKGDVGLGNVDNTSDANKQIYEANLLWGGKNFSGSYGPIDAAMIGDLGANRLAFFKPEGITVEYSRDNGSTWTDYGATDLEKQNLFSTGGKAFFIGKADSTNKATANGTKYQLRITLNSELGHLYTVLNKIAIYVSTGGSSNCTVTIDKALKSSPTTYTTHIADVPLSGWSGWNIINISAFTTYGNSNSQNSQYVNIRFTFKADGGNTNYLGLDVEKIMGFGGVGWDTPSTMAKTGHLYNFDASQNATFPAKVTATSFSGPLTGNVTGNVTGSSGSCTGNAATATKFASSQSITLTGDVTGSASSTGGWSIATTIGESKVTNAMLAGSIANGKLANSSIKIGNKTISLGETATLADIGVSYPITGVKGNAESSYRTGQVNLTAANIGAVNNTGSATMTGPLKIENNSVSQIFFSNSSGLRSEIYADHNNNKISFIEYTPNSNGDYEFYSLPAPTTTGGNRSYNILTDANVVTIPQGGTGATTASDARTKLGITPANIGAMVSSPSHISFTTSSSTTNGGYIDFHYQGASSYTSRLIEMTSGVLRITSNLSLGHPLSVDNGGTGATTPANACANLAPGIPTAAYTSIPNSNYGSNVSGGSEPLRCIKYGNGLKRLIGLISITGSGVSSGGTLCTVPSGFEHVNDNNGGGQGWLTITSSSTGKSHLVRFSGNGLYFWGSGVPTTGVYAVNYLYF